MRRAVLVVAVLFFMSPAPLCRTRCGLEASSNCADLQALENAALREFSETIPLREDPAARAVICTALKGWRVEPHTFKRSDKVACFDGWILEGRDFCVLGYTHADRKLIEVVGDKWLKNATMHELMHVVDIHTLGEPGHCNWGQRGVHKALRNVTGNDDTTEGNCP